MSKSIDKCAKEIAEHLVPIQTAFEAKGYSNVRVSFEITDVVAARMSLSLYGYANPSEARFDDKGFISNIEYGDNLPEMFERQFRWLEKLERPEVTLKNEAIADLGRVIDRLKDLDMPVEFMNPLEESMKALSDNIITFQPAAE